MPEHPVLACYRGPDSVGALQLAAALSATLGQPLVLASAYAYEPVALGVGALPSDANALRFDAAQAAVGRAHRLLGGATEVRERVVPAEGIPEALADLAREIDACVLVVGRDLDGDVTRVLLEHAPCPVAVSPLSVAVVGEPALRRIAVADDGSAAAAFARIAGERLAERTGTRSVVLTAPEGSAAGSWLVARSADHDLLLCGSRGRGRMLAAVLGTVSGRLVRAAHCPVLVVPPLTRRAADGPLGLTTAAR
jgi:nucleotide-binding universal stress UspA family protein